MGTKEQSWTCSVEGCGADTINGPYAETEGRIMRDGTWLCPKHAGRD